jgi:hypothetical protein
LKLVGLVNFSENSKPQLKTEIFVCVAFALQVLIQDFTKIQTPLVAFTMNLGRVKMIHYKDRWFCNEGDCTVYPCDRRLTEEDNERIRELNIPVCFRSYEGLDCYENDNSNPSSHTGGDEK